MATASLVLGIIGILGCVSPVGAISSIIGLILGIVAIKEESPKKARAKVGKTLGIIGICLFFIYFLSHGAMLSIVESTRL